MKKIFGKIAKIRNNNAGLLKLSLSLLLLPSVLFVKGEEKRVNIFDEVVFYDGYQSKVIDEDLNDGIIRFKNYLSHFIL